MNMEDIEFYNEEYSEEIDGVTVVHRGFTYNYVIPGESRPIESVDFYDANGNKFYSNFPEREEAEYEIEQLNKLGYSAVIGPKAPYRDILGRVVPNTMENAVGVYIVKEQQKKKKKEVH